MMKLDEYLDYKKIKINLTTKESFEGFTVNVDYAEDNQSGEDEIVIQQGESLIGFKESEIESIEILDEIED